MSSYKAQTYREQPLCLHGRRVHKILCLDDLDNPDSSMMCEVYVGEFLPTVSASDHGDESDLSLQAAE